MITRLGCIFGLVLLVTLGLVLIGVIEAEEPIDWITPVMEPVEMPYRVFAPGVRR